MDFGTAFRTTIHDYVGMSEENRTLKKRLNGEVAAIKQALNVVTVSGPRGFPIYATGSRPGLAITNPRSWEDEQEFINLEPFLMPDDSDEAQVEQHCPFDDISNAECRVGTRVFRFAEANDTEVGWSRQSGLIMYKYVFQVAPDVELVVEVNVNVNAELVVPGWDSAREFPGDDPSYFRNDQITSPVTFPNVVFEDTRPFQG